MQWPNELPSLHESKAGGQELPDLRLGSMRRAGHQRGDIVLTQMGRQFTHRAQAEPTLCDSGEELRKSARRPRRLNSLRGAIGREAQLAHAVGVNAGIACRRVQSPSIEFGDVRKVDGHGLMDTDRRSHEIATQDVVVKMTQRVGLHDSTCFGAGV